MILDERIPVFMSLDDDVRVVTKFESSYNMGLECQVIDGSLTEIVGNTIIAVNKPLPAGFNEVIGYGEDIQTQRGVYLIYNDQGNHSIYCYTNGDAQALQVAVSNVFNFQLSNKIRTVECVPTANGTLAFWTDGYDATDANNFLDTDFNSGREINIDLALQGFYTPSNLPITLQSIQRIKYPPSNEPTAVYGTDANYGKNLFNPANKLCQFAYCWEYYDNSLSTYSPLSALAVPYGDETLVNVAAANFSLLNNVINLTFNTGSYLVKQITIGVRFGNIGEFGSFITLNKKDLGILNDVPDYPYSFYNDRNITILDQADWIRLYDQSPQVENNLRLVTTDTGSNLVPMQITEGFDNTNVSILLQAEFIDPKAIAVNAAPTIPVTITNSVVALQTYAFNYVDTYTFTIPSTIHAGSLFTFTNTPSSVGGGSFTDTYSYSHIVTTLEASNPILLADNLYAWLLANDSLSTSDTYYSFSQNGLTITITVTTYITQNSQQNRNGRIINVNFYANITKYPTFKSGAKHLLGIEYGRDEGWEGTVQTANVSVVDPSGKVNGTEIYIPFISQLQAITSQFYNNEVIWNIRTAIFNRPPIWATKYKWVYAGNNTVASFLQFNACNPSNINGQTLFSLTPLTDYGVPATETAAASGENPNSILSYNYTPGDRCRLISQFDTTNNTNPVFNILYDVQVLSYDAATQLLCVEGLDESIFLNPHTLHNSILIELYTPALSNQSPIYYELSQTFDIGNPHQDNRYHKGLEQDQDPNNLGTVAAVTTLINGDCWLKLRWMADANGDGGNDVGIPNIIEDYNFSDFYVSNSYDKGRPNVINPYAKRQSLDVATQSQIFIPSTQINGLSSFWGFTTPFSPQNGIIAGSRMVGYELQVYQAQKVTSVLIQRTQLTNADNTKNLSASTTFFGSHNPRSDRYGTIYPESIDGSRTHGYFFDVINGAFIRVAQDRNWNLSELYKVNNWTLSLANAMKQAGTANFNVYGYYDQRYDKMYWTIVYNVVAIIDGSPNPDYHPPVFENNGLTFTTPITIIFAENGNKELKGFQGFAPFHPEFYGGIGELFLSFKNGNLYKHWNGATPNTFYGGLIGDNAPISIGIPSNDKEEIVKNYMVIEVQSNFLLSAPNSGDITVLASANYLTGMSPRLKPNKFIAKAGIYYAAFDRDLNTPNLPTGQNAILDGRVLSGNAMNIMLSNNTHQGLVLNRVIIKSLPIVNMIP